MPQYNLRFRDGRQLTVEGPPGATPEQLVQLANQNLRAPTPQGPTMGAVLAEEQARIQQEFEARRKSQTTEGQEDDLLQRAKEFASPVAGIPRGAIGMLESSGIGIASLLDEENELAVRDYIRGAAETAREAVTPETYDPSSIYSQVFEAVGSTVPLIALGGVGGALARGAGTIASRAGAAAATVPVAAGAGTGEALERARAMGVPEDELTGIAASGALTGLLDVLPLGAFVKALEIPVAGTVLDKLSPEQVTGITTYLKNMVRAGIVEGTQEGISAAFQNLIATSYDPDQEVFDFGVAEEAGLGGAAGAILSGAFGLTRRGRRIGEEPAEPETREAPYVPEDFTETITSSLYYDPAKGLAVTNADMADRLKELGVTPNEGQRLTPQQAYLLAKDDAPEPVEQITAEPRTEEEQAAVEAAAAEVAAEPEMTEEEVTARLREAGQAEEAAAEEEVEAEEPTLTAQLFNELGVPKAAAVRKKFTGRAVSDPEALEALRKYADNPQAKPERRAKVSEFLTSLEGAPSEPVAAVPEPTVEPGAVTAGVEPAAGGVGPADGGAVAGVVRDGGRERGARGAGVGPEVSAPVAEAPKARPVARRRVSAAVSVDGAGAQPRTLASTAKRTLANDAVRLDEISSAPVEGLSAEQRAMRAYVEQKPTKQMEKRLKESKLPIPAPGLDTSLRTLAYDLVFREGTAPLEGTGGRPGSGTGADAVASADSALQWIRQNGSPELNVAMDMEIDAYVKALEDQYVSRRKREAREAPGDVTGRDAQPRSEIRNELVTELEADEPNANRIKQLAKKLPAAESVRLVDGAKDLYADTDAEAVLEKFVVQERKRADKEAKSAGRVGKMPERVVAARRLAEELKKPEPNRQEVLKQIKTISTTKSLEESLQLPLPAQAVTAVQTGNTAAAIEAVASDEMTPARLRMTASMLQPNVQDTRVEIVDDLRSADDKPIAGAYDFETNTIRLDRNRGMTSHALVHEMTHAGIIKAITENKLAAVKRLRSAYEEVKPFIPDQYAATSLEEFVSEVMSNPGIITKLSSIRPKQAAVSPLRRIIHELKNIARRLFGMDTVSLDSVPTKIDEDIKKILSPAPETWGVTDLLIAQSEGKTREAMRNYSNKFLRDVKDQRNTSDANFIASAKATLSKRTSVSSLRLMLGVFPSQGLGDLLNAYGLKQGARIHELIEEQDGSYRKAAQKVDGQFEQLAKWEEANPDKVDAFNRSVMETTRLQIDMTKPRSEYKGDKEALQAYDFIQPYWERLGADGREQYKRLRKAYKDLFREFKDILYGHIDDIMPGEDQAASRKRLKNEIYDKIFAAAELEVYFPLARRGDFWLSYTVGNQGFVVESFETEDARQRAIQDLMAEGDFVTSIEEFSNLTLSRFNNAPPSSYVAQTLNIMRSNGVDEETQEQIMRLFVDALPETAIVKSMQRRKNRLGAMEDALGAFRMKGYNLARETVSLKYGNLLRSQQRQLDSQLASNVGDWGKVRGALRDAERLQDPTLKEAAKKRAQESLRKYAEVHQEPISDVMARAFSDEVGARVNFAINPPGAWYERVAREANQYAFVGTIGGNLSSAIVQTAQLGVVNYPALAGRTSFVTAAKSMGTAAGFFSNSGFKHLMPVYDSNGVEQDPVERSAFFSIDNYYIADDRGNLRTRPDLDYGKNGVVFTLEQADGTKRDFTKAEFMELMQPLVQLASDRSLLARSMIYDQLGVEVDSRPKSRKDKFVQYLALPFHTAERFNRQVTLAAAYLNELQRLNTNPNPRDGEVGLPLEEQIERARQYALYQTQQTNGGTTLMTAPRLAQRNLGRVAFMYKTYGIQMYYHQAKMMKEALSRESDPYVRDAARKQFLYTTLATSFFAGASGLTLFGIVRDIMDLYLGDDEESAETILREAIGEPWYGGMVNYLTKLAGAEADINMRIGLSDLILGNSRYDFGQSYKERLFDLFGGPFASVVERQFTGLQYILDGDTWRGTENLMPTAVRNPMQAIRFASEGARTRKQSVIFDDFTSGELILKAIGFAPARYERERQRQNELRNIDEAILDKQQNLKEKFNVAFWTGDGQGMRDASDDIQAFNAENPDFFIDEDAQLRSLKQFISRKEREIGGGVVLSKQMERYQELERISRMAQESFSE